MPAPSHVLRPAIEQWIVNHPTMSPAQVREALGEALRRKGMSAEQADATLPSIRAITRYKSDLKPEERMDVLLARWPESFTGGLLHWDISPRLAEWMRAHPVRRPTIGAVRWYARLFDSAPGVDAARLRLQARRLAALESVGEIPGEVFREVEGFLLTGDWPDHVVVSVEGGHTPAEVMRLLFTASGVEISEAARAAGSARVRKDGTLAAFRVRFGMETHEVDDRPIVSGPEDERERQERDEAARRYRAERIAEAMREENHDGE